MHDDSKAPRYGFQYKTDAGAFLEVHQEFGGNDLKFITTWYDSGSNTINLTPEFAVWFTSKDTDKYTVSFVNTTTKIIYCNLEREWSLAAPHLFSAGKLLANHSNLKSYL